MTSYSTATSCFRYGRGLDRHVLYSSALHAPTLSLELRASLVRQSRFIEAMSGPDVGIELRPPCSHALSLSHSLTLSLSCSPAPFALLVRQAPLFTQMGWTLLNSSVALCGYFASAALIDKRWYGR